MYANTVTFTFLSTVQNQLSSHTFREHFNSENPHLLFPCPHHHWHSWLLGRSWGNKVSVEKRKEKKKKNWFFYFSLTTSTLGNHPPGSYKHVGYLHLQESGGWLSLVSLLWTVACSYRHATLDIALVTCGPSCLTASWWARVKGKIACGFPSVSPWTSETVQWKLGMLQLICCRC